MKLGVISDTHNFLDPRIPGIFKGVDHILHAGDVGMPFILLELEQIAPVTAVLGNTDSCLTLWETEVAELAGKNFLIHHIVDPSHLSEVARRRITLAKPDVVVFGHTHKAFHQQIGDILYLNPGYAGKPRFAQPRSVAILHCKEGPIHAEFKEL